MNSHFHLKFHWKRIPRQEGLADGIAEIDQKRIRSHQGPFQKAGNRNTLHRRHPPASLTLEIDAGESQNGLEGTLVRNPG